MNFSTSHHEECTPYEIHLDSNGYAVHESLLPTPHCSSKGNSTSNAKKNDESSAATPLHQFMASLIEDNGETDRSNDRFVTLAIDNCFSHGTLHRLHPCDIACKDERRSSSTTKRVIRDNNRKRQSSSSMSQAKTKLVSPTSTITKDFCLHRESRWKSEACDQQMMYIKKESSSSALLRMPRRIHNQHQHHFQQQTI